MDYLADKNYPTTISITRKLPITLILLSLLIMIQSPWYLTMAGEHRSVINDGDITQIIDEIFQHDRSISSPLIDVETKNGIVTLSGTVSTLLEKDYAQELAQTIKGVHSLINLIKVEPQRRTDEELKRDAHNSLVHDSVVESYEVAVEANDGTVTLSGAVDSWAEKMLPERIIKGVRGVKDVVNNLEVLETVRPDHELRAEIRRLLEIDTMIDDVLVQVQVQDGVVTLSGSVGSLFEKFRAYHRALISGVKVVNFDDLKVEWWLRNKMKRHGSMNPASDQEIKKIIREAFAYDPRIMYLDAEITVSEKGAVTLSGAVNNLQAKRAAEETAWNTRGVWRVKNLLKVRPLKTVSDGELVQKVGDALKRDPFVSRQQVEVKIRNGRAYLYGAVDSHFESARAQLSVARVPGIIDVFNNLSIRKISTLINDDLEILEDIESQFFWSPFVDEEKITVVVKKGVAYLSGRADSYFGRRMATKNAWDGGAASVVNEIIVR